jgi:hypothetical protein
VSAAPPGLIPCVETDAHRERTEGLRSLQQGGWGMFQSVAKANLLLQQAVSSSIQRVQKNANHRFGSWSPAGGAQQRTSDLWHHITCAYLSQG